MKRFLSWRPQMGSVTLCLLVSLYLMAATNTAFWIHAKRYFGDETAGLVAFGLGLFLLTLALNVFLSLKYLMKPLLIAFIMIAGVCSYFSDTFGVIVDKEMIRNAVVTTSAEAGHLITAGFVRHVILFGILPSLLVVWVRIRHRRFFWKAVENFSIIIPSVLVTVALAYFNFASVAVAVRDHKDLLKLLNPSGPITAAYRFAFSSYREATLVVEPYGTDARIGRRAAASAKPAVVIVVAGETARAQSFSLNGYGRDTNPELDALGVSVFRNTTSCGTATAVSLPCMFSSYTQNEYSDWKARSRQNLVDVLTHAGIQVSWWENNTGDKGIATLIDHEDVNRRSESPLCSGGECLDEIFLDRLDQRLGGVTKDSVIVLHQMGSHGPAYYQRYPEVFRRFKPDCRTAELTTCSHDALVNAYDNTILYTDHILASVAGLLKKHEDRVSGAMIYMSDHGESLGDNGIYLHGTPYAIAPAEQTHVPFIAWFSPSYKAMTGLDTNCLLTYADQPMSHDNLFHTVLGMMGVETSVYNRKLDAFAACTASS